VGIDRSRYFVHIYYISSLLSLTRHFDQTSLIWSSPTNKVLNFPTKVNFIPNQVPQIFISRDPDINTTPHAQQKLAPGERKKMSRRKSTSQSPRNNFDILFPEQIEQLYLGYRRSLNFVNMKILPHRNQTPKMKD